MSAPNTETNARWRLALGRPSPRKPYEGFVLHRLADIAKEVGNTAGFVEEGALRSWRTSNVSLRGWRHVPPNHRKLRDLLAGLEQYAARADVRRAVRAVVIHLEFVTIHPFLDGNGRLGRLLLNLELLRGGLPWVTVREDERMPFFRAIERAQVDGETREYAKFLWLAVQNARREMASASTRRFPGGGTPPA